MTRKSRSKVVVKRESRPRWRVESGKLGAYPEAGSVVIWQYGSLPSFIALEASQDSVDFLEAVLVELKSEIQTTR